MISLNNEQNTSLMDKNETSGTFLKRDNEHMPTDIVG